jgi:tRNA A58 N-methylase Trm61
LKNSSYLALYLTNINQVIKTLKYLNEFLVEKIISVKEESWVSKKLVLRPEHFSLTHTAFLVFARKI